MKRFLYYNQDSVNSFLAQIELALFITPREKTFQSASVAVDRTVGQTFLSHLKNHVVEDCRIEAIDGEGHIQSFRNCVKMLFVSCYGFVFNSSGCDC